MAEEIKKKKTKVSGASRAKKVVKAKTEEKSKRPSKVLEPVVEPSIGPGNSLYALGRRKTSIARVHLLKKGKGNVMINRKTMDAYFGSDQWSEVVRLALKTVGLETAVDVMADVRGGGIRSQAEAIRLGLSRALIKLNPAYRTTLKKLGYLTRDPRAKERKKFGLKKARRAPQWSKR